MIGPFGAEIDFLMQELAAGLVASGRWGGLSNFFPMVSLQLCPVFLHGKHRCKKGKKVLLLATSWKKNILFSFGTNSFEVRDQ